MEKEQKHHKPNSNLEARPETKTFCLLLERGINLDAWKSSGNQNLETRIKLENKNCWIEPAIIKTRGLRLVNCWVQAGSGQEVPKILWIPS